MEGSSQKASMMSDLPPLHEVFSRIFDAETGPHAHVRAESQPEARALQKALVSVRSGDEVFGDRLAELFQSPCATSSEDQQSEWTRRHAMFGMSAAPSECSQNAMLVRSGQPKRTLEAASDLRWVGEETSGHISETEESCPTVLRRRVKSLETSRKRAKRSGAGLTIASPVTAGSELPDATMLLESSTASLESCDALWNVVFAPERTPAAQKSLAGGRSASMSQATNGI
ncbi:hypothetical protein FVE85_3185 [Porphyridium purpureum]|uniref:Uncharacterized protein n=1 Tax=Porphyridium purpureum TaxID=35688 RepID=A0A5J4YW48_PORPP|nr:hypothetical protein FVE85_3185 [Porphyridium purpureum]|eukprot:POR7748..scf227_4